MRDWNDKSTSRSNWLRLEFVVLFIVYLVTVASIAITVGTPSAAAHPGRTASDGCHNDRKNGGRHCHGGGRSTPKPQRADNGSVYYPNCAAARRAGAAPIRRGQPGYGRHLDRDNDGIGCE